MVKLCFVCKRIFEKATTRSYHLFPSDDTQRTQWFQALGLKQVATKNIHLCSDHFPQEAFIVQPRGRRILKKGALPINIPSTSQGDKESTSTSIIAETSVSTSSTSEWTNGVEEVMDSSMTATKRERDVESPLVDPLSSSTPPSKSVTETIEQQTGGGETASVIMGPSQKRIQVLRLEPEQMSVTIKSSSSSSDELKQVQRPTCKQKRLTQPRYVGDVDSNDLVMSRREKHHWELAKKALATQKNKIIALQQQNRRLRSRVGSLESLLQYLAQKKLITEEAQSTINAFLPPRSGGIIKKLLKGPTRQKFRIK